MSLYSEGESEKVCKNSFTFQNTPVFILLDRKKWKKKSELRPLRLPDAAHPCYILKYISACGKVIIDWKIILYANTVKQEWAASANLREWNSVFRVVTRFLYFFLLTNMKEWCIVKKLWTFMDIDLLTLALVLRILDAFELLNCISWNDSVCKYTLFHFN